MPTLEWIGKDKIINHHNDVPFRLLERKYSYDENGMHEEDNHSKNMIIHGDNLEALKALLPKYEGRIKCIYIDPPYNTGNEGWVYNDNVNDPRIRKWLGQVVGKEGEDLSRHDKWLCMMYPRIKLLQKLLHKDGALAISIGYHEMHNLMELCKEIFATRQVVAVPVQTSGGKPSGGFNYLHEYIIFVVPNNFQPNGMSWNGGNARTPYEGLTLSTFDKTKRPNQTYPIFINTADGTFAGVGESLQEKIDNGTYIGEKQDYKYDYNCAPEGTVAVWPITSKGKECVWRQIPERLAKDWEKGYIKISPNKSKANNNLYSVQYLPSGVIKKIKTGELEIVGHEEGVPTLKFGENETVGGQVPTIWNEKVFFTVNGTKELKKIFPEVDKKFDYPKSVELVKSVIEALSKPGDLIIDSFGGSATTAHAILNLNVENDDRNFILIEMMDYAEELTAERVKRVINGYGSDDDAISGTGGDFSYYELGQKLFDEEGQLLSLDEEIINEYLWYTETKQPYVSNQAEKYFLGVHGETVYYSFYNKDKKVTLNYETLGLIKRKGEMYVVYADACALSNKELAKFNISFKKIPRDIAQV
jgi:adenine-specific DNA-methyltransferase